MSTDQERIIGKVRKLLSLANDSGATESERENAMRQAHAFLTKYNLDMAQVEASGGAASEVRERDFLEVRGSPWVRRVAHGLAVLFFCQYFYQKGRGKVDNHFFVGRLSNVQTAKEMLPYLVKSIRAEAYRLAPNDGAFRTTFLKAAARRVFDRCEELVKEPLPDAVAGTALVVANYYDTERAANEAFLAARGERVKQVASRERFVGAAGHAEGVAFGNSVSLNRQVSGGQKRRLK